MTNNKKKLPWKAPKMVIWNQTIINSGAGISQAEAIRFNNARIDPNTNTTITDIQLVNGDDASLDSYQLYATGTTVNVASSIVAS